MVAMVTNQPRISIMASNHLQSRTLIGNWVEERQCAGQEEGNRRADGTLSTSLHRSGHRGILAAGTATETSSTTHDSFSSPQPCTVRTAGSREAALRSASYQLVSQQVHEEFHPPPPPPEYVSTTSNDYRREFSSARPPPTMPHNIHSEPPVTYWTQNKAKIMGTTQTRGSARPFAKNSAFSTPISHYTDQPLPHDLPF